MAKPSQSSQYLSDQFSMETDHSDASGDDFTALSRDRIPVRSLKADDINSISTIDRRITGLDRSAYYQQKVAQALEESGVRISLVAEIDQQVVGFIMARVDYGEFGQTVSAAVIDTIGVDPAYKNQEIGRALMSQLQANLSILRVESMRTEVEWKNFSLNAFLQRCGFVPGQRLALSLRLD